MSAYPDRPAHFAEWAAARGFAATDFVPRVLYGDYLEEQLAETQRRHPDRLTIMRARVLDLAPAKGGVLLTLDDGGIIAADAAVLALGNLPPMPPDGLVPEALGPDLYAANPWAGDIGEGLGADDTVLLMGSGLTMVDAALLLDARGFDGHILALSRRGLVPRRHEAGAGAPPLTERPGGAVSAMLRQLRRDCDTYGFRGAIDRMRPFTQASWLAASAQERARFLRHARPWWDVHRHRLAPAVADALAALMDRGRLRVRAGRSLSFDADHAGSARAAGPHGVLLRWRPRGAADEQLMRVRRVVNCTGPQTNLSRAREPVLQSLIAQGIARPDPLRLGLSVDAQARLITVDGRPHPRFFALGPMTRGAFWEINAVSDIRQQCWDLARRLSRAHWVEGEGL